ncbi:metallophosphoesterase [Verrucomicrobiaceae bacterium 227]
MSAPASEKPVIVPLKEVARVFGKAESAIHEEAAPDPDGALALAAIGLTLRRLHEAPSENEAVMETQQNGPISRLQSLIASGDQGTLDLVEAPGGALEAKFDTGDVLGWAQVAWARIRNPINHELLRPLARTQAFPNSGRVAVLGDWGTGLYGAGVSAGTITRDQDPYAMLLHLGDVYYSGTEKEMRQRFLDPWPDRPEAIKRAINGNHEMYSGGHSYFNKTLPTFEQNASYFAHQNDHWTLIGLDVAYKSHAIDDTQVAWLEDIIAASGDRKIILFSHHQLFSTFETQGTKLWENTRFKNILTSGKIFAWYWGHEHRACIFEPHSDTGILARCIGHGGMPESRKKTSDLSRVPDVTDKPADWRRTKAVVRNGIPVPASLILEGPNPYIGDEADKFLPHGYAVLNFDGPKLTEQVCQPDGTIIFENDLV